MLEYDEIPRRIVLAVHAVDRGDERADALFHLREHLAAREHLFRSELLIVVDIDQGEIQPIGGATEKIEGFYEVCKIKGLTGKQGVMIPWQNVRDLALNGEIVRSVAAGLFHVYPIVTVDEGIALLTGVAAGEADADGNYPAGTVHGMVEAKLKRYHDACVKEKEAGGVREGDKKLKKH